MKILKFVVFFVLANSFSAIAQEKSKMFYDPAERQKEVVRLLQYNTETRTLLYCAEIAILYGRYDIARKLNREFHAIAGANLATDEARQWMNGYVKGRWENRTLPWQRNQDLERFKITCMR